MTNFEHGFLTKEELQKAHQQYSRQRSFCKTTDKRDAAGNPVEMKMSFEQWMQVWIDSGKYHLRGKRKGCYVMGRKNDLGHYEVGNVDIIPTEENISFAHKGVNRAAEFEHVVVGISKIGLRVKFDRRKDITQNFSFWGIMRSIKNKTPHVGYRFEYKCNNL